MCWDRIIEAETPSTRKAEPLPPAARLPSSPLTLDTPELVETR